MVSCFWVFQFLFLIFFVSRLQVVDCVCGSGFSLLVNFVTCSWHPQCVSFAIWWPKTGPVLFKISFGYRNSDDGCLCLNRIAKDPRFERLPCIHKGTYADDCIVERITKVHFDYNIFVLLTLLIVVFSKCYPLRRFFPTCRMELAAIR